MIVFSNEYIVCYNSTKQFALKNDKISKYE